MTTSKNIHLLTDDAVINELGQKLRQIRLRKNITQTALAKESGVAKRTIERFENGSSLQLTSFVRLLRALGMLDDLMVMIPDPTESPMAMLLAEKHAKYNPGRRQRASKKKTTPPSDSEWTWGE